MEGAHEIHVPVLLGEVVQQLRPRGGGIYVDCTVGAGGHTEAILGASVPDGHLLGFDADAEILERQRALLSQPPQRR